MSQTVESGVVVGLIGGRGSMGRWLEQRLVHAGCRVLVADVCEGPVKPEFVADCQIIVVAVPISAVEEVMAEIGPYTRPDGLVMDIASLKEAPLAAMLKHARGEVVGCHPLCGPTVDQLEDQIVFLCEGRGERWRGWVERFWESQGARVVEIAPERHDRLMAVVQSLRHLLLYGLGDGLRQLGFDLNDLELAGPRFRSLMELLQRQVEQPPSLYAELALGNPHVAQALEALTLGFEDVKSTLARRDRRGLEETMARVEGWSRALVEPEAPRPRSASSG